MSVLQRIERGEKQCQLCTESPATAVIRNKHNGKSLNVCRACLDYLHIRPEPPKEAT